MEPFPLDKLSDDALAVITIWGEARGEPPEGKAAVASVIKNRMKNRHQSDGTVRGTVLKPKQFSMFNPGDPNLKAFQEMIGTITPDSKEAQELKDIQEIWSQVKKTPLQFDANLYHAEGVEPSWAKSEKVKPITKIGNHLFYKEER